MSKPGPDPNANARINPQSRPNPGIDPANTYRNLPPMPGPISPDDFKRDLLTAGHQRQSPGDVLPDGAPAATAGNASKGGTPMEGLSDPMSQMPADFDVVRASDFARGIGATVPGSAATGVPSGVRAAISPQEYWHGDRDLHGYESGSRDRSPLPVNSRGGQVTNNDANKPARVNPRADTSPSVGADVAADIAKEVLPAMTLAQYRATKDAR
jgi:hypothetical protein